MLRGRSEEEGRSVEDVDDARALAKDIRERASRLRVTPGLLDGTLEELRGSLDRVLREYEKMSRRRLGPFQRELEAIAKRAQELKESGRLSPRHLRLLSQGLQHAHRIHFWNAKRVIAKIDKILGPTREWQRDVDAYRAFQRKAAQRVRDTEDALAKLHAVPKPSAAKDDVGRLRAVIEAANRAADEAWVAIIHRPSAEAITGLVAHPDVEGLGLLAVQEFAALRELSDLFETDEALRQSIGLQPLSDLVLTSEYSAAKWDRVYQQAAATRRTLQNLFHQLRPVVGGKYGTAFTVDAPVAVIERRLGAWRNFPGAESKAAWSDLVDVRASGKIPAIQESARIYERHGDLAVRAWDGSLADDIAAQEKELLAAKKVLDRLPSPDTLA